VELAASPDCAPLAAQHRVADDADPVEATWISRAHGLPVESIAHLTDGFVISQGRYLGMGRADVMRACRPRAARAIPIRSPPSRSGPINEASRAPARGPLAFSAWFVETDPMRGVNDCEVRQGRRVIHATARC
jgi:hypothetical protein